jgi:peptidyl-prolyl cis-trans isomerase A (cyclophilin A)
MHSTWKLIAACSALALMVSLGGCGSGNEGGTQAGNAAADAGGQAGTSAAGQGASAAGSPGVAAATVPPTVVIETQMGNITIELDYEKAPITVENFLSYVEDGFYDGTIFHQVFPGAVILGGMFTADLTEKPAHPPVSNEAHNGLKNLRGTIAMARQYDVINSATCQFFINVKDNPNFDHKPEARQDYSNPEDYGYCVFGRVSEASMAVVDQIANVEVRVQGDFDSLPAQTVLIKSVRKLR